MSGPTDRRRKTHRMGAAWIMLLALAQGASAQADDPRITAIDIGQSGIALYTLSHDAEGGGHIRLTVPGDHADDVLASLVVRDPAGGVIGLTTATPSTAPEALRGTPFAQGLPGGTEDLLRALIGKPVRVIARGHDISGVVLGLSQVQEAAGDTVMDRATVLLLTPEGTVAEVVLTPGASVEIPPDSAAPLTAAAQSLGGAEASRSFDLTLAGTGPRRIALSYVTEAPAWKNSWRLSLGEKRLQGWATFENTSGHDWAGVEVTLSTGAPVAYRRALLDPLRISRVDPPMLMPGQPDVRPDDGFAKRASMAAPAPVMTR